MNKIISMRGNPRGGGRKFVLWAFDPFQSELELQKVFARALRQLARGWSCQVQPVYVASEIFSEILEDGGDPPSGNKNDIVAALLEQCQKIGQEVLDSLVARLKLEGVLYPLIVLPSSGPELHEQVATLASYAHQESVDLVVVGTHARTGPARWVLGSFAELLVFESGLPLYVINPHWKFSEQTRRILFPTDFSTASYYAFERLLEFAKLNESRVTLFHQIQFPASGSSAFGYGLWPIGPETGVADAMQEAQQTAHQWVLKAGKCGIGVTVLIHSKGPLGIVDSILKSALMGYDMIAMAAESGSVATVLLGSVTRKVVRGASCPVWVVRQPKMAKTQEVLYHITEVDISLDLHLTS